MINLNCGVIYCSYKIYCLHFYFSFSYACFLCGYSCYKIIKIWTYIFLTFARKAPLFECMAQNGVYKVSY